MTTIASPSRTAAATLAEFCAAFRWDTLEGDVQTRTRELLLDVIGADRRTSAVWAAMANGTAAHAVELDDVTTESSLHPGVAVIPAALAVAEEVTAEPKALLEAIMAGY